MINHVEIYVEIYVKIDYIDMCLYMFYERDRYIRLGQSAVDVLPLQAKGAMHGPLNAETENENCGCDFPLASTPALPLRGALSLFVSQHT